MDRGLFGTFDYDRDYLQPPDFRVNILSKHELLEQSCTRLQIARRSRNL